MSINLKALLLKKKVEAVNRKAISTARSLGKSKKDAKEFALKNKNEELRKNCLGLILEWTDRNPQGEGGCDNKLPKATSVNPSTLVRDGVVLAFQDATYRKWMINQEFNWEIDIELYFKLPNSKTKSHRIDPIYFHMRGCMKDPEGDLSGINQRIEKAITYWLLVNVFRPDGDKNKGVFEVAKYRVSVVGL